MCEIMLRKSLKITRQRVKIREEKIGLGIKPSTQAPGVLEGAAQKTVWGGRSRWNVAEVVFIREIIRCISLPWRACWTLLGPTGSPWPQHLEDPQGHTRGRDQRSPQPLPTVCSPQGGQRVRPGPRWESLRAQQH